MTMKLRFDKTGKPGDFELGEVREFLCVTSREVTRGSSIGARAGVFPSLVKKRARVRWFRALRLALCERRIRGVVQKIEKPKQAMEEL